MEGIRPINEIFGIYSKPSTPYTVYEDQLYGDNKDGLQYLVETRKLKPSTLQHFHIGFSAQTNEIVMPVFREGGLIDYKFRSIIEKTFRRHAGGETWAFHDLALQYCKEDGYLIVTEGEIDACSIYQLGFRSVLSISSGAQGPTPWVVNIPEDIKVYLNFDGDEAGQEAAQKIAERIGLERCFNIVLPIVKDANDYLVAGGTKEDFQKLLDSAQKFRIKDVFQLSEVIDKLRDNKLKRFPVFSERLTKYLDGGIPAKSLVCISGRTGIGKSSALTNFLVNHADNKAPVLLVSLENDLMFTIQRILETKYKKSYLEITPTEWDKIKTDMMEYPFYVDVSMDSYTVPRVEKLLAQAKKLYGVQFFGFDHIGFLPTRDDPREISQMVRAFKLMARQHDMIIYMVSHIRKTQDPNDYISGEDLKGSSAISQDSDIVLLVVGTKDGLEVNIDKARMSRSKLRLPILFEGKTGVMEDDNSRPVKQYDLVVEDSDIQTSQPSLETIEY